MTQRGKRVFRVLATWAVVAVAVAIALQFWRVYINATWTRDGQVRAYVVTVAPEVAGQVVKLALVDNQFVHKGDVLFEIEASDYRIALDAARAALESAQAAERFRRAEATRRAQLSNLSVSAEQQEQFASDAAVAAAATAQAATQVSKAELNLARTQVRAPVDGWVTNLLLRRGDFAQAGGRALSLVDANSFWVDGYFEETNVRRIADGDPATVWLMGDRRGLNGHVDSVTRGIQTDVGTTGSSGLANVNPVFTWVRLAQRVPVRIALDPVPAGIRLVAGMTASVQVYPRAKTP